jgi:hypothetical protein
LARKEMSAEVHYVLSIVNPPKDAVALKPKVDHSPDTTLDRTGTHRYAATGQAGVCHATLVLLEVVDASVNLLVGSVRSGKCSAIGDNIEDST